MKSGLEDRNNQAITAYIDDPHTGLNEVRPGRPEQLFYTSTAVAYRHLSQ